MSETTLHVVLGAGPAGKTIVDELVSRRLPVRHVSRSAITDAPAGVETQQADLSSPEQAMAAVRGATSIYHAVNVPYHLQVEQMPGIGQAVLSAAAEHGARLIVLDTLYPYGCANGCAITEQTPWAATSRKGRMRAELDQMYLDAHRAGRARVALGRSADFFGPRVFNSTLGATFFPAALTGQPAIGFGDTSLPHSYSWLPDIARGLVELGTADHEVGDGRVWHLPTVPAVSTDRIRKITETILGKPIAMNVMDRPVATGPFDARFMSEYAEIFYQHLIPQNMVSSAFERNFGLAPT